MGEVSQGTRQRCFVDVDLKSQSNVKHSYPTDLFLPVTSPQNITVSYFQVP